MLLIVLLDKNKNESFILQMNSTNQFSDSLNAPRNHTLIITEAAIIIRWKAFLHVTQLVQSNQGTRIACPLTNHIQRPSATIYTTFVTRLASILFIRIFFWGTFGNAIWSIFDVFAWKALICHLKEWTTYCCKKNTNINRDCESICKDQHLSSVVNWGFCRMEKG